MIHNASVTVAENPWPAALRVDAVLLRAADIQPLEEVEIVNLTTGERFRSWVEPAAEGSGEVRVHSGTRHPVRNGDLISIVCYGFLHDGQTIGHRARVVTVDAVNSVVAIAEATGE